MSNLSADSSRIVAPLLAFVTAATLGMLLLPGFASATPSDFQVGRGLLRIDSIKTDARGRTQTVGINLSISGGQFTYDQATGALSQLTVTSDGNQIDLAQSSSPSGIVRVNQLGRSGNFLLMANGGISMPGGTFGGSTVSNIRLLLVAARVQASAVVPVGPGPANAVPEPAAAMLFAGGLLVAGLGVRQRASALGVRR